MRHLFSHRSRQRGVALIITLAILGIITLLVVGFAISMRTEQIAARSYGQTVQSQQLADAAVPFSQVAKAGSAWDLALVLSAALFLVGHAAFALNALGMIFRSSSPASQGRHD